MASIFLAPTEGKGKDKGKAGSKGKSSSSSLGSPAEMAFMVDAAVHNLLFFLSEILSCIYWPVIHSELRYSLKLKMMMMMIRSGERGGKEPGLFPATQRSVPWLRCSLCCCLLCCSSILSFAHSLIDWLSLPSPLSTGYARCSSIEMLLVPWNICWTKAPALLWWIVPADTTGHLPWVLCYGRFWQLLGGKKIHVKNYDDYCWWWVDNEWIGVSGSWIWCRAVPPIIVAKPWLAASLPASPQSAWGSWDGFVPCLPSVLPANVCLSIFNFIRHIIIIIIIVIIIIIIIKVETKHIEPWVFVRSGGKSRWGRNDNGILARIVNCWRSQMMP